MSSFILLALISECKICNINPTKVLKQEEFTSNRMSLVRRSICPLFHCFGSTVNSCFPKAKGSQSLFHKQNNCPSFGYKSTSSLILTDQATFASIYTVQKRSGTSSKAFLPASSYTLRGCGCFLNLNNVPAYLNMRTQNITYNRF